MKLIAITGGIGSGKSVVARMVKVMGFETFDCDTRAKSIMAEDADVRRQLVEAFGAQTFLEADGAINRTHLSATVFGNNNALARLNSIVHPATVKYLRQWAKGQAQSGIDVAFVETALLRTAGMEREVDEVWRVTAPDDTRVSRVVERSGLSPSQIRERMAAQHVEDAIAPGEKILVNDNQTAVLPQIMRLLNHTK